MLCTQCSTIWPYAASAKACLTCGAPLRLTSEDLLGPTKAQIVSETRPQQVEFAKAIEKGLQLNKHVTAEAGTGTGKSFAALLPVILAGRTAVVSSATIALQSQYMTKDLPYLKEKLEPLGVDFTFAIAKGRSNYYCPLIYAQLTQPDKKGNVALKVPAWLDKWTKDTHTGDRSEHTQQCPFEIWVKIQAEDCLGEDYCPMRNDCQFLHTRSLMKKANIIVANHAITGFDIRFGLNRLLPLYDVLILDEAHKANDYFGSAFTETLSEKRAGHLVNDMDESGALSNSVCAEWASNQDEAHRAREALEDLGQLNVGLFTHFTRGAESRVAIPDDGVPELPEMGSCTEKIMYHLATLANIQGGVPTSLEDRLRFFYGAAKDGKADRRAFQFLNKLKRLRDTMRYIGEAADPDQRSLRYVEYPLKSNGSKLLSKRPIDIGPILRTRLFPNRKVMAVSATITVGKSFDRFHRALGFPGDTLTYEAVSPFDFDRRALLYLSKNVRLHPSKDKSVQPDQYDSVLDKYFDEMADDMYALCSKSNGHAFALFTSTTEMNAVFTKFMLKMQVNQFTLVQQGQYSPAQAERKFRESKNPILFGLKSFWEGISIEGDQLRLVMIAKVPFPQRDDLLHEELKKQLEEKLGSGYRAFMELDVTQMVMETKQAAGRLIRTMKDYGVVAILDRKISDEWKTARNSYAKILVHDLPFTQVTSDLAFVTKFLQQFQMKDRDGNK